MSGLRTRALFVETALLQRHHNRRRGSRRRRRRQEPQPPAAGAAAGAGRPVAVGERSERLGAHGHRGVPAIRSS